MDWEGVSAKVLQHVERCLPAVSDLQSAPEDQPLLGNPLHAGPWLANQSFSHALSSDLPGRSGDMSTAPTRGGCDRRFADCASNQLESERGLLWAKRTPQHDRIESIKPQQHTGTMERRMELAEGRIFGHEQDVGSLSVRCGRAEGMMAALLHRQDDLDVKTSSIRDSLALLDRRSTSAERALRTAISEGQMMSAIRSVLGQFRDQVEERLSAFEQSVADSIDNTTNNGEHAKEEMTHYMKRLVCSTQREVFQDIADKVTAAVKVETDMRTAARIEVEKLGREAALSLLKQQLEASCHNLESAWATQSHRDAEVTVLVSQMQRQVNALASTKNEEVGRIRRELQESQASLRRRIEEVRDADDRRMREVSGELRRARDVTTDEKKEIWKELSGIQCHLRHALAAAEGRQTTTDKHLSGVEASLDNLLRVRSETRDTVGSMETKLKTLQMEIQGIHRASERIAAQLCQEKLAPKEPCRLSYPKLPQTTEILAAISSGSHTSKATSNNNVSICSSPAAAGEGRSPEIRVCRGDIPKVPDTTTGLASESPHPVKTSRAEHTPSDVKVPAAADVTNGDLSRPLDPSSFLTSPFVCEKRKPTNVSSSKQHTHGHEGNAESSKCVTESLAREATSNSRDIAKSNDVVERGCDIGCMSYIQAGLNSSDGNKPTKEAPPGLPAGTPLLPMTSSDTRPRRNVEVMEPAPKLSKAVESVVTAISESHVATTCALPSLPRPDNRNSEYPHNVSSIMGAGSSTVDSKTHWDVPGRLNDAIPETQRTLQATGASAYVEPSTPKTSLSAISLLQTLDGIGRTQESTEVSKAGSNSSSNSNDDTDRGVNVAAAAVGTTEAIPATFVSPSHSRRAACTSAEAASGSSSSSFSADGSTAEVMKEERRGEERKSLSGAQGNVAASNTNTGSCKTRDNREGGNNMNDRVIAVDVKGTTAPPPNSSATTGQGARRASVAGSPSAPSPISVRERAASKDSGVVTAQCEFCLRRYLRSAMSNHLEVCELRLVRCPYQCGVRILVHNIEKHEKCCSLRPTHSSTVARSSERAISSDLSTSTAPAASPSTSPTMSTAAIGQAPQRPPLPPPPSPPPPANITKPPTRAGTVQDGNTSEAEAEKLKKTQLTSSSRDTPSTVTCMRCHESLPFHLVPAHGLKCKGQVRGSIPGTHHGVSPQHTSHDASLLPSSISAAAKPDSIAGAAGTARDVRSAVDMFDPQSSSLATTTRVAESKAMKGKMNSFLPLPPRFPANGASPTASLEMGVPWGKGGEQPPTVSRGNLPPRSAFPYPSGLGIVSDLGSALKGGKNNPGSLISGLRVPSPLPRPKKVDLWTTTQVTSWLSESMRPPRADVISRFHHGRVDGAALLELTDRDLLHPTEGLGITDTDTRRQILELVDALD